MYPTAQTLESEWTSESENPIGPARAVLVGVVLASAFWALMAGLWFLLECLTK